MKIKDNKGFSLIETLIVLAILATLGSIILNVYKPTLEASRPRTSALAYMSALREAQDRSKHMMNNTTWGVSIRPSMIVVFSGNSYAARIASFDKIIPISSVTNTGPTEVVFARFTGIPNVTGTSTFSNAYASSSVGITSLGMINI